MSLGPPSVPAIDVRFKFDASEFQRVEALFARLPDDMQNIAFRRAVARTKQVVKRAYARFASRLLKVPQKLIMQRTSVRYSHYTVTLRIKSKNIPLHEIGAYQRVYGVYVRGRGYIKASDEYNNPFIPSAKARRAAGYVLRRRRAAGRLPTYMLFGPNPANAVGESPAVYEDLLSGIARTEFQVVVLQQVAYLLSRG